MTAKELCRRHGFVLTPSDEPDPEALAMVEEAFAIGERELADCRRMGAEVARQVVELQKELATKDALLKQLPVEDRAALHLIDRLNAYKWFLTDGQQQTINEILDDFTHERNPEIHLHL